MLLEPPQPPLRQDWDVDNLVDELQTDLLHIDHVRDALSMRVCSRPVVLVPAVGTLLLFPLKVCPQIPAVGPLSNTNCKSAHVVS